MNKYKHLFPIFKNNPKLIYLDSAASAQKPKQVIDRIKNFYEKEYSNIHRGLYQLSEQATENYENARQIVANFLGAQGDQIVFTRNTTESINLIAKTWGRANLQKDDEVLISEMEHHSNLVPWQEICRKSGVRLKYLSVDPDSGQLNNADLAIKINQKTKVLAICHVSNVLGTINDLPTILRYFKKIVKKGIAVGDFAQSVAHLPINLTDFDFIAFSGHKMYGSDGIGVLFGQNLNALPHFLVGGGNIQSVSQNSSTFQISPWKFEAGTPNIAGALGLAEAIKFIQSIGIDQIVHHEQKLTAYALEKLTALPYLKIYGSKNLNDRIGVIAFNIRGIHAHDIAQVLADENIAIRAGHHCAMPLHQEVLKVPATCRVSFGIYNDEEDVDQLIQGLKKAIKILTK